MLTQNYCWLFTIYMEKPFGSRFGQLVSKIPYCGIPFGTGVYHLHKSLQIGHFTVVYSVTRPLNGSEAAGDLVLIQTSHCFYHVYRVLVMQTSLHLHKKNK